MYNNQCTATGKAELLIVITRYIQDHINLMMYFFQRLAGNNDV